MVARLELPPRIRVPVEHPFHSLAYLHAARRPERRIGLHSPTCGEVTVVQPHEWGNIWVYGMDIFLTGWLSHEDYRHKANMLNPGMHTLQYDRTSVKILQVPIAELNPLKPLFERVQVWGITPKKGNQEIAN
jgi:hypothetical protein